MSKSSDGVVRQRVCGRCAHVDIPEKPNWRGLVIVVERQDLPQRSKGFPVLSSMQVAIHNRGDLYFVV